jgi:hypothetical protein
MSAFAPDCCSDAIQWCWETKLSRYQGFYCYWRQGTEKDSAITCMWKSSCPTKGLFVTICRIYQFIEFVYLIIWSPLISYCWLHLLNMQQMPKGRDVEDDDTFVFNDTFTAPLYRIKVPYPFLTTKGTQLTDFKLSFKF